ncbi:MAG: peptidoglycan DD-metalloendopeptidase family protein [Patescibacteria group bacterium]|nr:peptidoglycan DD-metalloendopeptidase family protein [Patescibacteria group bacterium]
MRIFIVIVFVFFMSAPVFGQTSTPTKSPTEEKIQELQRKITELQNTELSLSKELKVIDSQISVAQSRIEFIKTGIQKLGQEINELIQEIERLESVLTRRSELVLRRIPESYKRKQTPYVEALFLSKDFGDLVRRVKYIAVIEREDVQLLVQLKATQTNFSERKNLREQKRKQQEELRSQLEKETKELEIQKRAKQVLLQQTRNSEAEYQRLLAQALAEQQAINKALLTGAKVGPVKKGDPIALVGNTGYPACSTGPHLHYEIRKNNVWVNVEDYLSPRTVRDEQTGGQNTIGRGSWDWPLEGNIVVTQHFGKTPYSWRYKYSGGIHTGIDMYSTTSEVIRAPADGILFSSAENCGGSSIIKIKYIDHGDGLISLYLHVQ